MITSLPTATKLPKFPQLGESSHPRLFRGLLWDDNAPSVTPSADRSETLRPLPAPPRSETDNTNALETLRTHSELFDVVTPIDVHRFELELRAHPNRPLVDSVLRGLREGFWPFADYEGLDVPDTWEEDCGELPSEAAEFVAEYAQEEEDARRYSQPFGQRLFPGMVCMPLYAVPKPHSDKLRLVNDHSAGSYALNAGIKRADVGMRQDNVQDLGQNLLNIRQTHGDIPIWLFKSDVSHAYRLLPMHPLWQLKQVVRIRGEYRVDRCCCFGSRGSPDLWCTFMSLVLWIAKHRGLRGLLAYMDDNFSHELNQTLTFYEPYKAWYPHKQVLLLRLWDELCIPHKKAKQEYGHTLTIIGFHVDTVRMTITLPRDSKDALVAHIRAFVNDAPNRRRSLREWQRTLGWINWGLNFQPLLRPALESSYAKIKGKEFPRAPIYLNRTVKDDLLWVAALFDHGSGVHLLTAKLWPASAADLLIFCDASLTGLGFWSPQRQLGFAADLPVAPPGVQDNIFWYEAVTVLAALRWASTQRHTPRRLAIFTDNLNTVQIFDSLRASAPYNLILREACEILIQTGIDLRVCHVPGATNTVADALSRHLFALVRQYTPMITISTFSPPEYVAPGATLQ